MNNFISELEGALQHCEWCYEERPYVMYDTDASYYLSQAIATLKYTIEQMKEEMAEEEEFLDIEPRNEWISIAKKSPKAHYVCLLLTKNNLVCIGQRTGKEKYEFYNGKEVQNVTHWAYLPRKKSAKQ